MNPTNKSYHRNIYLLLLLALIPALLITGCGTSAPQAAAPAVEASPSPEAVANTDYAGKMVVYVNSYHEGYPWSDGIETGLHTILDGTGVELKIIRLDTKQNPDVAFGESAGAKAWAEIQTLNPDVVIASDDNAQKYLIVPFMKDGSIPVIFNGVNWDGSAYGFPATNMTGMIEVELPDQLVELLKAYANGERVGYITVDSETERKVVDIYNQRFFNGQMTTYWVTNQQEFKDAFLKAQDEVDILIMGNNAGSSDAWDEAGMTQFVNENSKVPTGSINDWMAPYSLLTLAKSSQEQGEWSAQAALSILGGTPPSEIPVAENKKGQLIVNLDLAEKLNVVFAPSLLKTATILGE